MAIYADVLNSMGLEGLQALAYGDGACPCGQVAGWVDGDLLEFRCGRCRGPRTISVPVLREALLDLARTYGDACEQTLQTNRLLPLPTAQVPTEIGAYVLFRRCQHGELQRSTLGVVVAMLADCS